MVDYVRMLKEMVEKYENELKEIERAIEVMEKAGEDATALKVKLSQVKDQIDRWKKALG